MIMYMYESPPYLLVFSGFTYYHLITAHRISLDIWKPNNHPILLQKTLRRRQNDRQTQGSLWKTFTEAVPRVSTSTHSGSLPRRILRGGLGYPKKNILKPSLNINNNFNHREKNVIIHPQSHSWRWVWSTISKKKTLSSKMRNGSSYTWKARGWWHKSGNVHCKIARDDRCWKLQVKLADEKCWNKMIKNTSESTVRGTFLLLTIEFYLDKRWETVACCMLPY